MTGAGVFFVAVTAGLVAVWAAMAARAQGARLALRVTTVLTLWLGATLAMAATGRLAFDGTAPPRMIVFVMAATALTTYVAFSAFGSALAAGAGIRWLVGFQAFRILVEIFLWWGSREGFVPVQMTFEGRNFDVLTGVAALGIAWFQSSRRAVLIWNIVGLGLLLNILGVAILSMPTPIRAFFNEPANTFVTQAPYVWLPAFLVQSAWMGHLLVFRWLRARSR